MSSNTVTVGNKPMSALWDDFKRRASIPSKAELEADGWRWGGDIARELGMSKPGTESLLEREGFAKTVGRLDNGQRGTFYRPVRG